MAEMARSNNQEIDKNGAVKVYGSPINGINDYWNRLALIFAEAAEAEAGKFVKITSQEEKINKLELDLAELEKDYRKAEEVLSEVQKSADDAEKLVPRWGTWMLASFISAPLIISFALLKIFGTNIALILGLILISGSMGLYFYLKFRESNKQKNSLKYLYKQINEKNVELKTIANKINEVQIAIDNQKLNLNNLIPMKIIESISFFPCTFTKMNIAGFPVVVDDTGIWPEVSIQLPNLTTEPDIIETINNNLEVIKQKPVLLRKDEDAYHMMTKLHGEESKLKETIELFMDMIRGIQINHYTFRILPKKLQFLREINVNPDKWENIQLTNEKRKQLKLDLFESKRDEIDVLNNIVKKLRKSGIGLRQFIEEQFRNIENNLEDYNTIRRSSVSSFHDSLKIAMNRSSLTEIQYFCPKCNRIPSYLFYKLGVNLEESHLLNQEQLITRMLENDEIADRITKEPSILDDISNIHNALLETLHCMEKEKQLLQNESMAVGSDLAAGASGVIRYKSLENQYNATLNQYQALLRKLITGNDKPLYELSRQAKLYIEPNYDIDDDGDIKDANFEIWQCGACQTVYDDPKIIDMGRLMKVNVDLLMPMWQQLWTEMDDFRKSEIFRTNEQLQRLSEKESEKLIDIGEQYRADMRPVRENLIRYSTEAKNKIEQLSETVEGLYVTGMIDRSKKDILLERSKNEFKDELGTMKRHVEAKELLLNLEPQAQVRRRSMAVDPINFFMTPDKLFNFVVPDHLLKELAYGNNNELLSK